jgi:glutaminase
VVVSSEPTFVSTGRLPDAEHVQQLLDQAHARFGANRDGETSAVYPALAAVPGDLFGICFVGCDGAVHRAGDSDVRFSIMSVSKPFVFALVCQAIGADAVRERIGVNSTGLPFNSVAAVERDARGRTNPMVNAGAIATTSLAPGADEAEKWHLLREGLSRFAGRALAVNQEVLASAMATNSRNQALARMLESTGGIYADPAAATALYTKQCALEVSAADLAVMGATLADGGVNPISGEQVVDASVCHYTLAVMATAGLYETSGDWLYEIGLPGKSGIGGGIVTVAPGKGGLGTFAPRLDVFGNSIKGQLVARHLSRGLGLDLFASRPARV